MLTFRSVPQSKVSLTETSPLSAVYQIFFCAASKRNSDHTLSVSSVVHCLFQKKISDFLGNFRSTVLLVSSAPGFVSLPCMTPSSAALETLFTAQNILRNTALLQFPRKSIQSLYSFCSTDGWIGAVFCDKKKNDI